MNFYHIVMKLRGKPTYVPDDIQEYTYRWMMTTFSGINMWVFTSNFCFVVRTQALASRKLITSNLNQSNG